MFGLFKRKNPAMLEGQALFEDVLIQAHTHGKAFFADLTPTDDDHLRQQRFEVVSLFMVVLLWRMKGEETLVKTAQAAYDTMFLSFDRSLREGGVGDIGVSHRIKKYAQAFHGRLKSYGEALDTGETALLTAIENNMKLPRAELEPLAKGAYIWAQSLKKQPITTFKTTKH